jgi:hypothetical protein
MDQETDRRTFLGTVGVVTGGLALSPQFAEAQQKGRPSGEYALPADLSSYNSLSLVLGRAGDQCITANLFAKDKQEAIIEYGTEEGKFGLKSKTMLLASGQPIEVEIKDLRPNTRYFYRLRARKPGAAEYKSVMEGQFHTQRSPGSTFTFCVQGDSHPERPQMSQCNLYARTLQRAAADKPDLYFCMGDDFSVNKVRTVNAENLAAPYLLQRPFLSLVAQFASLYLVNGNHEQASLFNFNEKDELHEVAVGVQTARNKYYPMPANESIYTGDDKEFKGIGLLRDYFAWTWGDALFVVLDNYWHSPAQVDTGFQGGNGKREDKPKNRDWWEITLGDEQYQWFKKTLEASKAKYKFVFAHHVLGTGRGGIEASELYEWGGKGKGKGKAAGADEFKQHRPKWAMPVHQLMVKHGVSIFFQGHDHLYAQQERDGVIYQEVPLPADPGYSTYNEDAYSSGTKKANSGYLRVTVSPKEAKVEYVRCWLTKDESDKQKTGDIAHSYTIKAKA